MARSNDAEFGRPPKILFASVAEKAGLEAQNALRQYDLIGRYRTDFGHALKFTPEIVCEFHRCAIRGIYACAGVYRDSYVGIENSRHVPPKASTIPVLIAEMCAYANTQQFAAKDQVFHVPAYLLWRLNWIHPFFGGNGRTARAISYLALSVALQMEIPGSSTVVDQLINHRRRYYDALEAADAGWNSDLEPRVELLEALLSELLIIQIESAL